MNRKSYPTDVSDEEWNFVAPCLALIDEHSPQRRYSLREVFNALRWCGVALVAHDFPSWEMVYQQFRRWNETAVLKPW